MAYEHGQITDEGVARIRAAIGHTFTGRQPWRTEVTRDAVWHLAHAIGDLSPLYTDEEYVKKTHTSLWIEHEWAANAKLKKSPAYYE